jgi:hypothetical protein
MQQGKVVVRAIDRSEALDGIAQTVAMPAREKPATPVELRGTTAAVHAVARHVTDEPGALATEAACCPPDRNKLANGFPLLAGQSDPVVQPDGVAATGHQN